MWLPQLARQIATIDAMCAGRLTINIISSDMPGESLDAGARYRRTRQTMAALRALLSGQSIDGSADYVPAAVSPPRVRTVSGQCPPMYFGGFSDDAKDVAAAEADVFLTWPDTVEAVAATVTEMRRRAADYGRSLRFGLRSHVVVRPTEAAARAAADRLVSRLDDQVGQEIRNRSLDASSRGVRRQAELRYHSDESGYAEPNLWTGIGRARSGAGAAIVGSPEQVRAKLDAYRSVGIDAFILSGYPHLDECERFADLVLRDMPHHPLSREGAT